MGWFEGTHSETRVVDADLEAVKAHFSNLETVAANTADVEKASVDGDTIHFLLTAQDHGVVKFQGDYKAKYTLAGDELSWGPVGEGNTKQSGKAVFRTVDGGTEIVYDETVSIELDLPAMMAPMIKPVISALLASEIKGFVKKMATTV